MKKLLLALLLLASPAFGANLNPPAAAPAALPPCSPTACTGFYGGFNIMGLDQNGSIGVANGGAVGLEGGYQYWTTSWYFGANVWGNYAFQGSAGSSAQGLGPGYRFGEFVDLGVPFGTIFGLGTPTIPSAGSSFPSTLGISSFTPFITVGGLEKAGATGWGTGAGLIFDISSRWFAKIEYIYGGYNNGTNEQMAKLGLNYKF